MVITFTGTVIMGFLAMIVSISLWGLSRVISYLASINKGIQDIKEASVKHEERIVSLNEKHTDHENWLRSHDKTIQYLVQNKQDKK